MLEVKTMKKDDIRIPARSISLLVTMKQRLMDDNDLCSRVTDCGKFAAAHYIDELIQNALEIERRYHEIKAQYLITKEENNGFDELLDGYTADILSDEEKAEIHSLVKKWKAKDERY